MPGRDRVVYALLQRREEVRERALDRPVFQHQLRPMLLVLRVRVAHRQRELIRAHLPLWVLFTLRGHGRLRPQRILHALAQRHLIHLPVLAQKPQLAHDAAHARVLGLIPVLDGGHALRARAEPTRAYQLHDQGKARLIGLVGLQPLAWIVWAATHGQLGANPIAEALNRLGLFTLIILFASLTCTPVHILTGWSFPLRLRKLLGLEAFLYAALHFTTYIVLDQGFDWGEIWKDIVKRKFMTVGFAAFVLLIPLVVTSTKGMVRRLGFPRWKRLHRLVYLVAVLGVIHFVWRVKSDYRQPTIFAFVLAVLLLVRVVDWARGSRDPERHRAT